MSTDEKLSNDEKLEDLLVEWQLQREHGCELTAEALCADRPELVPELRTLMSRLKATDWIEESADFADSPAMETRAGSADETWLPDSPLSADDFCQRLVDSGVFNRKQTDGLRENTSEPDARSLARRLVAERKLTQFQAVVLLEGRDIPLTLDRYVLLSQIGKGGMGAVYKALHEPMDRIVAIKVLLKSAVDSPDKVKRFQREVKAAAQLDHPNIVTAFDAHEANGVHFLVMAFVDGSDLDAVVRQGGPLSAAKAVDCIAQAARGLEHAHRLGIIHRDIKPANLLLAMDGTVKILDMGLARISSPETSPDDRASQELTQAGTVMGTIAYLAPEQAVDTRTADLRSDIYSLGCTLHFLLTGRPPYVKDTMVKTILAHREDPLPSLCSGTAIPVELDSVFQKMVAKRPEDRFQNATDLLAALEILDLPATAELPTAPPEPQADTVTFFDTSREVSPSGSLGSGLGVPLEETLTGSAHIETVLVQPSERVSSRRGAGTKILGALLAAAALLFSVIYLTTPYGKVRIEIVGEDPGVVVSLDGDEIRIGQPTSVRPGEYLLAIRLGDQQLTVGEELPVRVGNLDGNARLIASVNGVELSSNTVDVTQNGTTVVKLELASVASGQRPDPSLSLGRTQTASTAATQSVTHEPTAERSKLQVADDRMSNHDVAKLVHSLGGRVITTKAWHLPDKSLPDSIEPITEIHIPEPKRPITNDDVSVICQIPNLQQLTLSIPEVTPEGLIPLRECRSLTNLDLRSFICPEDTAPVLAETFHAIGSSDRLWYLAFSGCQIPGNAMTRLAGTPIKTLMLQQAQKLKDDFFACLPSLPQLETLEVCVAESISIDSLKAISACQKLRKLDFFSCNFSEAELEPLRGMQLHALGFHWYGPPPDSYVFSDKAFEVVSTMENLRRLTSHWTTATRGSFESLARLKHLEYLMLGPVRDAPPDSFLYLRNCRELSSLILGGFEATSEAFRALSSLDQIKHLELGQTLAKAGHDDAYATMMLLKNCSALESLKLHGDIFSTVDRRNAERLSLALGQLTQLSQLKLETDDKLSKSDCERIHSLNPSCEILSPHGTFKPDPLAEQLKSALTGAASIEPDSNLATLARTYGWKLWRLNGREVDLLAEKHVNAAEIGQIETSWSAHHAVDDSALRLIEQARNLKSLTSSAYRFTPASLACLTRMESLENLHINKLFQANDASVGELKSETSITSLPKLETVSFWSGSKVPEGLFLSPSSTLKTVKLDLCEISEHTVGELADQPVLESLDVINTNTHHRFGEIARCKSLNRLAVHGGDGFNAGDVSWLASMKLDVLWLSFVRPTREVVSAIAEIQNLKTLSLLSDDYTEIDLSPLRDLTKLESLELMHLRLSENASIAWIADCPELKSLKFTGTNLSNTAAQGLEKLTQLQSLDLRDTGLSRQVVVGISKALPDCQIASDLGASGNN